MHQRPWCVERTLRYSAFYLELELAQASTVRIPQAPLQGVPLG